MEYSNKMLDKKDIIGKCVEPTCGKEFVFSVGEQEYFQDKGLKFTPTRCLDCRRRRKAEKNKVN